jgi:hypothetical protein
MAASLHKECKRKPKSSEGLFIPEGEGVNLLVSLPETLLALHLLTTFVTEKGFANFDVSKKVFHNIVQVGRLVRVLADVQVRVFHYNLCCWSCFFK